jgi:hypothetical protein
MPQFAWVGVSLASLISLLGCGAAEDSLFSTSGFAGASAAGEASAAGANHSSTAGAGGSASSGQPIDLAGAASSLGGAAGGAAGAAGDGAGGTITALSVEGACQGKVVLAPALLADFEHGVSGWSGYMGEHFGPLSSSAPGAALTGHAATFAGGAAQTSGMFRTLHCSDVSAYDGISFYAKGWGGDKVRFLASIPATDPIEDGGDCDEGSSVCWDHPGKLLVLSDQWQQYHVAWSELAQYGWGTKATFAGIVNALLWINDGPVNEFEFSIDQVRLYKGVPTP